MSHKLQVDYRPDNYPDWIAWRQFDENDIDMINAPGKLGIGGLPIARGGFFPRLSFGKPQDGGDRQETGRSLRRCYNVQVRFRGNSYLVLDRFRLHAQKLVERATAQNKP